MPGSNVFVCDIAGCNITASSTAGLWNVSSVQWRFAVSGSNTFRDLAPGEFGSTSAFSFNATSRLTTATLSIDATTLSLARFQVVFRNCFGNSSTYGTWTVCSITNGLVAPRFVSPFNQGPDVILQVPGTVNLTLFGGTANLVNTSGWRVTYPGISGAQDARGPVFATLVTLEAPWNMSISFSSANASLHNVVLNARAINCATPSGVLSRNYRICFVNESSAPFVVSQPIAVVSFLVKKGLFFSIFFFFFFF